MYSVIPAVRELAERRGTIHGVPAVEILRLLEESRVLSEQIAAEQEAFPGQGGRQRYFARTS